MKKGPEGGTRRRGNPVHDLRRDAEDGDVAVICEEGVLLGKEGCEQGGVLPSQGEWNEEWMVGGGSSGLR